MRKRTNGTSISNLQGYSLTPLSSHVSGRKKEIGFSLLVDTKKMEVRPESSELGEKNVWGLPRFNFTK